MLLCVVYLTITSLTFHVWLLVQKITFCFSQYQEWFQCTNSFHVNCWFQTFFCLCKNDIETVDNLAMSHWVSLAHSFIFRHTEQCNATSLHSVSILRPLPPAPFHSIQVLTIFSVETCEWSGTHTQNMSLKICRLRHLALCLCTVEWWILNRFKSPQNLLSEGFGQLFWSLYNDIM